MHEFLEERLAGHDAKLQDSENSPLGCGRLMIVFVFACWNPISRVAPKDAATCRNEIVVTTASDNWSATWTIQVAGKGPERFMRRCVDYIVARANHPRKGRVTQGHMQNGRSREQSRRIGHQRINAVWLTVMFWGQFGVKAARSWW